MVSPVNVSLPWVAVACSHDFVNQVALATNQVAYTSNDSGLTWTSRANSLAGLWVAAASNINRSYLVVVRNNGFLVTTPDLVTWTRRTSGIPSNVTFTDVAMSNSGGVILATESPVNNRIYVSTDSGAAFTARGLLYGYTSCAMNDIGDFMVVTPRQGNTPALYSRDYGVTWIEMGPLGVGSGDFYGSAVSSSGQVIHISSLIGVRTSRDFGQTWRITATPCSRIRCSSTGKEVVTFNGTKVYYSTDYGESFLYKDLGLGITDIAMNRTGLNKIVVTISNGFIQILDLGSGGFNLNSDNSEIPPTPIYDADDLNNMRKNLASSYILMNDIYLSNWINFVPIGTDAAPFTGALDGNNFSINNLTLTGSTSNRGLFGATSNSSTIKNLRMVNPSINTNGASGILVAKCASSLLENIIISGGTLSGIGSNLGGLIGESTAAIDETTNIVDCKVYAKLDGGLGSTSVGGIVGLRGTGNTLNILRCVYSGEQNRGDTTANVGGIIGYDSVVDSGLTIQDTASYMFFWTGGAANVNYVGGIAGRIDGSPTIQDCAFLGNLNPVLLSGSSIGGIAGAAGTAVLTNCYTNIVGNNNGGGLVGTGTPTVTSCYHIGPNNSIGTFVTLNDLKLQSTFVDWDFEYTWKMREYYNTPKLKWDGTPW